MIASGSCASTSSAAMAGWRPTPTSARNTGRWCGPWPGSGGPPGQRSKPTTPGYVLEALGPVPASTRGRRAWRQAAAEIEQHRRTYQVTDPDRALGSEPREPCQRADRQRARTAIERVHTKQRVDRSRDAEPTRESTIQPQPHQQRGRPGPERAAG